MSNFTRHIATSDYSKYLVADIHEVTAEQSVMLNNWMKSWTKEQRVWIFRHFGIPTEDGRLTKMQGVDIRPYLADIALQLSMVKGYSVVTGYVFE